MQRNVEESRLRACSLASCLLPLLDEAVTWFSKLTLAAAHELAAVAAALAEYCSPRIEAVRLVTRVMLFTSVRLQCRPLGAPMTTPGR